MSKITVEVKIKTDTDEYIAYRIIEPSILSYSVINQEEELTIDGKRYKINTDTHVGLERVYEKTN